MKDFNIKPKYIISRLTRFISETTKSKGFRKVILGLSGGLDSTVVAYLSCQALGAEDVIGVIMPYGESSSEGVRHAKSVAKLLKIKTEYIDISDMIDAYFRKQKGADRTRRGNKMARERMAILYDLSKKYKALVIGTSNKTERLLGYGTIYGDAAWALNPIGGLYKTQVKVLAGYLGIPSYIVNKMPTAGLWPGQTDEGELGYPYSQIDRLLFLMVEKRLTDMQLAGKGFSKSFLADISKRIRDNRFKGEIPAVANI